MPTSAPEPRKESTDFWLRLRDADETALAAIVKEYEPEIRRAATMRLGPLLRPHLDSVDLVQSVYITLLKGLRGEKFHIAGPQELVALSAEIIRRKVAQVWKRLKRRTELNNNLTGSREDEEHVMVNREGEPDPTADAELRDAIERIMQECDPADKKLLQLRLEGHSTAEAARALDADPDVLRVRLSRLRKRLTERGLLAEWL
ncbi:MAG: sigma-70 family RNA polymerase sigma factor [Planctomycetia bacterium]|nr:sigma-70 family RNA polymerase sigma factor [Planctomycetia bacterium]